MIGILIAAIVGVLVGRDAKKYGMKFLSSGLLYRYASYQLLKFEPKIFSACKKASLNVSLDLDFPIVLPHSTSRPYHLHSKISIHMGSSKNDASPYIGAQAFITQRSNNNAAGCQEKATDRLADSLKIFRKVWCNEKPG